MEGTKLDQGKPRFDLILPEVLLSVAKVLAQGAEIHGDYNWKELKRERIIASMFRHANAIHRGEYLDDGDNGTGEPHASCLICNAMFLSWHDSPDQLYTNRGGMYEQRPDPSRPIEGAHIPGHSGTGSPIYDPSTRDSSDSDEPNHEEAIHFWGGLQSEIFKVLDKGGTYESLRTSVDNICAEWNKQKLASANNTSQDG